MFFTLTFVFFYLMMTHYILRQNFLSVCPGEYLHLIFEHKNVIGFFKINASK